MPKEYERDLGTFKGRTYWLRGRAEPGYNNPDRFAAIVYYPDPGSNENVQIARVDCAHNFTHFDRLYRRDEPKDSVQWDFWEAMDHLGRNWRTYAQSFENK